MHRRFLKWLGLSVPVASPTCLRRSPALHTPRLILWDGNGSSEAPFVWRATSGKLDNVSSQLLYARLQAAPHLQRQLPGYSTCGRCEFPGLLVTMHSTPYEWADQRGIKQAFSVEDMPDHFVSASVSALCEDCWTELKTPEIRLPYYMALVDHWQHELPDRDYSKKREQVRHGVLTEGQPPPGY